MKARCGIEEDERKSGGSRAKRALIKVQKSTITRTGGSMTSSRIESEPKAEDTDRAEMKVYLDKLQELVPFTPKNKTLSKLEVITSAIFYIRDLRETLGLPPCQDSTESSTDNFLMDFDLEEVDKNQEDCDAEDESSFLTTSTPVKTCSPITTVTADFAQFPVEKSISPLSSTSPEVRVSHSPITSSPSLSDQCSPHHIKRQPLCAITSPNNMAMKGQRISQKS